MKKLKIKRRVENSVNAFFDESVLGEYGVATFNKAYVSGREENLPGAGKTGFLTSRLKESLLFLPSAFYLFFGTMAFFMFGYVTSNRLIILAGLVGSSILMVFGIGNVRKPEHFLMPLSVVALGALTFLVFSASGISTPLWSQEYAVYVFPLALMIPFFVRGWVDKKA